MGGFKRLFAFRRIVAIGGIVVSVFLAKELQDREFQKELKKVDIEMPVYEKAKSEMNQGVELWSEGISMISNNTFGEPVIQKLSESVSLFEKSSRKIGLILNERDDSELSRLKKGIDELTKSRKEQLKLFEGENKRLTKINDYVSQANVLIERAGGTDTAQIKKAVILLTLARKEAEHIRMDFKRELVNTLDEHIRNMNKILERNRV